MRSDPVPSLMMKLFKLEAAFIVLMAVVALAFFPAIRGPFSATHGPIATLRTRSQNFLDRLKSAFASIRGYWMTAIAYFSSTLSARVLSPDPRSSCVLRI
jgi:hypothetical protein